MARIPSFLRGRKGGGDYKNTPDTIRSEDTVEVILGVGEGDNFGLAEGAKSFLMGGTALVNSNDEANVGDFQLTEYTGQANPPAIIPYLGGFGSPKAANAASLAQGVPIVRTGELTQIDYLDLRFLIGQLVRSNDKGTYVADLQIRVEYRKSQPAGSPWVPAWSQNIVAPGYDQNTSQPGVNVYSYGTDAQDYKSRLVTFQGDDVYLRNEATPGEPIGDFTNIWVHPTTGRPSVYSGGVWTPVGTDAGDSWSYGTTKFFKNPASPPPAPAVGDVWTPPGGSKPLKFNGSSWVLSLIGAAINSKYAQPLLGNSNGILNIQQKITSPVVREVRVPVPRADVPYDLRITKITADSDSEGKYISEVGWESFEEIIAEGRSFPNTHILHLIGTASDQFTQLPELLGDVKGRVIDVPSNYDPVTRTYAGVWDGLFKKAWTDNGAWATRDFIKDSRYGLSALYPLEVREANFYNWAVWCDQVVPDNIGGTRARWTYNDDLSEPRQAKAQAEYMAGSCGGKLIDDGSGTYDVLVDRDEPMTMIFGPENIANDGEIIYSFSDEQTRANWIKVGFINPEKDWSADYRVVKDDDHIAEYGRIPLEFVATGKTNLSEALAAARLRLITGTTEYTAATWRTNRVGKFLFPFKVVGLCDPDMGWGISGRASAVTGARQIRLRDPIYLEAGLTHKFTFNLPTSPITTATVIVAPGQSGSLTVINFTSDLPTLPEFPQFSVSTFNGTTPIATPKAFKILTITPADGDSEIVEITALELNRNKWAYVDGTGELLPAEEYTNFDQPLVSPQNVKLSPYIATAGGITRRSLQIQWDRPANPFGRNTLIEYSSDGGEFTRIAESETEYYELKDLAVGTHAIRLTHVHVDGVHKSRPVVVVHEIGEVRNVPPVVNARLADEAQSNIYESISPMFRWDHGDEDPNFRTYRVRVRHPVNNDVVRTVDVPLREFIYEFDKNTADFFGTPSRAFKVSVTKVDDYGNESIPSLLSVSNPSPQAPVVTVEGTTGGVNVKLSPSDERDIAGAIVQVDTEQTPLEKVLDVDQGSVFIPLTDFDVRLIRAAYYDRFSKTGLNWSQSQEVSKQATPMEDVQGLLGKLASVDEIAAQTQAAVADLEEVYGDTVSAAQSAVAASASASTAAQAKADAIIAQGAAQAAQADALAKAQAAAGSATTANTAKTAAETARTQAQTAKTGAETAQADALAKAQLAAASAGVASGHATTATQKADAAKGSADAASGSATTANTKAGEASVSAGSAASSASDALGSKNAAATSATTAATARDDAGDFADAASSSATSAAGSASAAGTSASAAATAKTQAETARGQAQTYRDEASESADDAAGSASTATTQAGLAANSATAAGGSATAAAGSASTATTKATEAGNSASAAAGSSVSAASSATAATSAAVAIIPDTISTALWAFTTTAGAPDSRASLPTANVVNGAYRPGVASTATGGPKQYVRWETGRIYELTFIVSANGGTAANARVFVGRRDSSFAAGATIYSPPTMVSAESEVTITRRFGMGVTPSGGTNIAQNNAEWIAFGVQGNINAGLNGAEPGADQLFKAFKIRDVTALVSSEIQATASATSAASSATSADLSSQSASAANQSKLDAQTAQSAAGVSATNAADSATNAAGSASTASTAAGVATAARDAAGASATAAGTSATNAASSATDAGISATAATTASVTASTASAAAQVAAIATFPNVIVADLFSNTTNGVAPETKPSIPATLVSNGIFTPPTGSGGTLGFKQYLPWVPGFIFEITAIFDAPAGSDPAGYGRLFVIRAGADYGSLGSYFRPVAAVAPGAEVTQTVRYGMGVTPVGGVQIAPTAGLTWVSIGAQINLNAGATGGQAGAKGRIKALIVRDVTAQAGAEGSASAAATSASNASASETASGQSASAAQTAATTATTKAGEASTSATAAATSASNASASETASGQSASAAQTAATTATTKAGEASTSASSASTSATNAAGSASTAATQAGLAAGSRDAAAGSASAAAGSASTATTKAGEAGTSAAAASASQVSASTARDRAAESASNASYLDVGAAFTFANTVDGWGVADGSLSPSPSGARFVQSGSDPQLIRSGLAILGSRYTRVIVNLTRTKARASGTWNGNLYYATDSHSFSDSFRQIITRDPAVGERTELTWDMPALTNGGTDWLTSTIRVIRLDLDQGPGGEFTIHGVRVVGSDAAAPAKSASAAATSASLASASETAAGQSATAASGSATTATTKAGEASTFASQASTSASNAAGSASTASTASGVAVTARDQANTARDQAQASAASALTQAANASASASSASISANLAAQAGIGSLNKNPTYADWPTGQSLPNTIGSFGSVTVGKAAGKVSANAIQLEVASGVSNAGVEVAWTPSNWNGRLPAVFGQDNYWVIDYKIEVGTGGLGTSLFRFLLTNGTTGANASALTQMPLSTIHSAAIDDQILEGSHFFKCNPTVNTTNYSARLAFFARGAAVSNYGRYTVHKMAVRPATATEIASGVALPAVQAQLQVTASTTADLATRMATAKFEVIAAAGSDPAQLLIRADNSGSLAALVASEISFSNVVGGAIVRVMRIVGGNVFITGRLYIGGAPGSGVGYILLDGPNMRIDMFDEADVLKMRIGKLS